MCSIFSSIGSHHVAVEGLLEKKKTCNRLEDMKAGGSPGMCGSMIYGHLWSKLAPATRPACCISGQRILLTARRQGINDPRVASLPQVHLSHMRFLIMWQFISGCLVLNLWLKKEKKKNDKNELSVQPWTCDSLLSNHFRGHSKQGVRKRKRRWSRFCVYKKWVKRDMFLLAPRPNSFLFCYSMQNCVGELYSIFCNASMENLLIFLSFSLPFPVSLFL